MKNLWDVMTVFWAGILAVFINTKYVATQTAKDNEVYTGCGFDSVPGQPQVLKFCNAYGHCIKSYCGPDHVFSKVHCGCVQALQQHQTLRPSASEVRGRLGATGVASIDTIIGAPENKGTSLISASKGESVSTSGDAGATTTKPTTSTSGYDVVWSSTTTYSSTESTTAGYSSTVKAEMPTQTTSPSTTEAPLTTAKAYYTSLAIDETSSPASTPLSTTPEMVPTTTKTSKSTLSKGDEGTTMNISPSQASTSSISFTSTTSPPRSSSSSASSSSSSTASSSSAAAGAAIVTEATTQHVTPSSALPIKPTNRVRLVTRSTVSMTKRPTTTPVTSPASTAAATASPPTTTTKPGVDEYIWLQNDLPCGAEVNITGMAQNRALRGAGAFGAVYIGNRGVVSKAGHAHFDGLGFLWVPFYEGNRFTSGFTVHLEIREDTKHQIQQGLVNNCGMGTMPSFSITLVPKAKQVKFTAVVMTMDTPYPFEENLEVTLPYTPGINKTIELQSDGRRLIGRVNGQMAYSQTPTTENYELSPRHSPLYIGKGCRYRRDVVDNFYGDIMDITVYRCIRPESRTS